MTAVRQDAWTEEDDLILAEVTLRHIREGSTQLSAFDEVGARIGRTPAACGFRWNSCVRKRYEEAIQQAKAQRQKRNALKKQNASLVNAPGSAGGDTEGGRGEGVTTETISIDAVIRFLRQWKASYQEMMRHARHLEKELASLREEVEQLRRENEMLNKQVNEVESDYRTVNDDYKALIKIMERARKLAFLNEEDEENKQRFKMDANGNLEKIE